MSKSSKVELTPEQAFELAYKKLMNMYETETGQKFIHHLIYAFKQSKRSYDIPNIEVTDCITHRILSNGSKEGIDGITAYRSTGSNDPNRPNYAVSSELSNRFLGVSELNALDKFVEDQCKLGNPVIKKLSAFYKKSNKRRSKVIKPVRLKPRSLGNDSEVSKKLKVVRKSLK